MKKSFLQVNTFRAFSRLQHRSEHFASAFSLFLVEGGDEADPESKK
jgi:hypothetical protein